MIKVICDKEYRISYKSYAHFLYNKSEYYFAKKEYTHFRNFRLEELKNEKTL